MKKTFFIISFFAFIFCLQASYAPGMENATYMNLTNDINEEVIVEETISIERGISETIVNIYKYTDSDDLKLIWSGIKKLGFLTIYDRLPPYEDTLELPFCLISDISMIDIDDDGVMEIEVTTKKVYYDKETSSRIVSEKPVHTRIFSWDKEDQRYE